MESFDYAINYRMTSELGDDGIERFINEYNAEIIVSKPSGEKLKIGRLLFSIVLVNRVREEDANLLFVFDSSSTLADFASEFIDFEQEEFNDDFFNSLSDQDDIYLDNICVISELELLPGFRGKGLGAVILKDLYVRFGEWVGAIFISSTPFQNTMIEKMKSGYYEDDEFSKAMKYEDLEFDEESAQYKLNAFFQKLGFKYITNNYFLLNTRYKQPKLMAVDW
jgi:GNAT superfamily N-acetyltransferase